MNSCRRRRPAFHHLFFLRCTGNKKGMRGHALITANAINKNSPSTTCPDNLPGSLRSLVPNVATRFSMWMAVFITCHLCACFGREKGVRDKLQRHPLIYPIFPSFCPLPGRRRSSVSVPFARENLHLVVPRRRDPAAISPLFSC